MANLFNTFSRLTQLKDNNGFSNNQRNFITTIIDGTSQWSPLIELAQTTDIAKLNGLKTSLEAEIANTSYLSLQTPHWNYQYLSSLKRTLSDVKGVLKQREHLQTYSEKKAEKYNKFANRMDTIYKQTVQTYHGTIMCPVIQALEPRLGDSKGECFGYVAQWAVQILKAERPFGVGINQQQTIKPISFASLLARKHPEINHFAVLTKEISTYQKLQSSVGELVAHLSSSKDKTRVQTGEEFIDYHKNLDYVFYSSTTEMAQALVKETQIDPHKVYNLNVMTYLGGHALGFCMVGNKYHFFDSNAGWFRFENDKDFINWFSFYYKQRGYQSYYLNEYEICSYSLSKKINNKQPDIQFDLVTIAIITITSPIIAVIILGFLIDMFVIRGFRYLGIAIHQYFNSRNEAPTSDEHHLVNHVTLVDSIPQSLAGLDLAVQLDKGEEDLVQSTKVLDYLDLAVNNKTSVKNILPHLFFKEPSLIKINTQVVEDAYECRL